MASLLLKRICAAVFIVLFSLYRCWISFCSFEELHGQLRAANANTQEITSTTKARAPAPPVIIHRDDHWPRSDTDIFLPAVKRRTHNSYSDYNIVAYTICCPGQAFASQALNEEYFSSKGISYVKFNHCEGGADWDRIKKAREIMSHSSHAHFLVWMDCDAGVVAGPQEDTIDPFDQFLSYFDLHNNNDNNNNKTEEQVGMVVSRHADYEGGPVCNSKSMDDWSPMQEGRNDCLVNSGVFVLRNNPVGRSIVDRFEQIMTWENVTSPVGGLPDNTQSAFNKIIAEQVHWTGTARYPIRPVFGAQFNRRFPPLTPRNYIAVHDHLIRLNEKLHLFNDDRLHHPWSSSAQGELMGSNLLAKLVGWGGPFWNQEVPTFIVHLWGTSHDYRTAFWDCAYAVQPRSANRILDQCGA